MTYSTKRSFIETLSNSRIMWAEQTPFRIDDVFDYLDAKFDTDTNYCNLKTEILGSDVLIHQNGELLINREGLMKFWESTASVGAKMLLSLFWGGINKTRSFKIYFIPSFIQNITIICNLDENHFKKPLEDLFQDFEGQETRLEGVSYAFFSKFFQFAKPNDKGIICDQWTMKAIATYLITKNEIETLSRIFAISINKKHPKEINIQLRKVKGSYSTSYSKFIRVFERLTQELTESIEKVNNDVRIAEKLLFGWNRKEVYLDYDNPRHYYQTVILEFLKSTKVWQNNQSPISGDKIKKVFIYKQPNSSYFSLRISQDSKSKIGYFDNNYWLCMHKKYSVLIQNIVWESGNTKGGSESCKYKFDSIDELVKTLRNAGLDFEYVNCDPGDFLN